MLPVSTAQSPPQPDSPNYGVEVRLNQIAGGSNENVVRDNQFAQQPNSNTGVSIGGNQMAGKDNNNNVSGNRIGHPSPVFLVSQK